MALRYIGDAESAAGLAEIATSGTHEIWERLYALRALASIGAPLDDRRFEALARAWGLWPRREAPDPEHLLPEAFAEVLSLARGPSQRRRARRWFASLAHTRRAQVLQHLQRLDVEEALHAELYAAWRHGASLRRPEDRRTASRTLDRPQSRALLLAACSTLDPGELRRALVACSPAELDAFAADRRRRVFALRNLAMPTRWMVQRFGVRDTLRRALAAFAGSSRQWFLGGEQSRATHARAVLEDLGTPAHRWQWLAEHPDLHPELASLAQGGWLSTAPPEAFDRYGVDPLEQTLRCVARSPEPGHRAFLLRALDGGERWRRYWGIEGLERLGEDGAAWRTRLHDLAADPDPAVRTRALGALAVRGDGAALDALRRAATGEPEGCARAEAVGWLGRADPKGHEALLIDALRDDARYDGFYHPVVAEAAVALARAPSDAIRTALLRAYLRYDGEDVMFAVGAALRHAVLSPEQQPPPRLCSDPWRWIWLRGARSQA